MRPSSLLYSFLLVSTAFSAQDASAGLPNYKSRKIESKNGQYVLVLLTPKAERQKLSNFVTYVDDVWDYLNDEERQEVIGNFEEELAIEGKYPVSGLYTNDGSTEPIWKIPYISLCQNVHIANDGIHMVVMYSPWDSSCSGTRQLSFYKSGSKVYSYVSEFDFVPFIFMRHFMWLCLEIEQPVDDVSYIDNCKGEFIVHTNQHDKLAFDLATGARKKCSSPWPFYFGFPLIVVPLGLWIWHRRRPSSRKPIQRVRSRGLKYSLGELLGLVTYVSFLLAVVKMYGWCGGACVLIATIGSATAGFRNRYAGAWAIGAILALYGAYVAALSYAAIEGLLHNSFGFGLLWWRGGWWLCIPLSMVLLFAICGAVFARWMISEKSSY